MILIVALFILLLVCGGVGGYRYGGWRSPMYGGGLGLVVVILLVLLLLGYL